MTADTHGWPVREVGGKRVCARPGTNECHEEGMYEYRIDGYCSIYCRDMHKLERDIERLRADLASAERCGTCGGDGQTTGERVCVCGGTGARADETRGLRADALASRADLAEAVAALRHHGATHPCAICSRVLTKHAPKEASRG